MKKLILTVILSALSTVSVFVYAKAPAKEITCRACHGALGGAPIAPNYPKLQGQNKAYLISALKAYAEKQRLGGLAGIMTAQVSQLSDEDIDELADYYSKQ